MRTVPAIVGIVGLVAAPLLAGEVIRPRPLATALSAPVSGAVAASTSDFPRAKKAVTEFLDLTADQVTQWDELFAAREAAVAPLREQLAGTQAQIQELLKGDAPDPNALGTLMITAKTLREGIHAAQTTYLDGFAALLDDGQKAKLGSVRRAARLAPLLPSFGVLNLLPPGTTPSL